MGKSIIRRGYYSPRWVVKNRVSVPSGTTVEVPASSFINDTIYRMRLISLSFTSDWVDPDGTTMAHPPWANYMLLELGKTGCSDQNLVKGTISGLCAMPYERRLKMLWGGLQTEASWQQPSTDVRLPRPYRLPRDCGLEVTASNRNVGPDAITGATFIAKAHADNDGSARILAGQAPSLALLGGTAQIDSADLYNKGRQEILIDRMTFGSISECGPGENLTYDPTGTQLGWIVNPTVGMAWMSTDEPIPAGNLGPMTYMIDQTDVGPRMYAFPPETYLAPEQNLGIKLTDLAADADSRSVNICLFGELEVK